MNKGDKKKDRQLETWANQDRTAANAATTAAAAPNPLLQRQQERDLRFMDWEEGKGDFAGKPRDIRQAPGMETGLALYDGAAAARGDAQQGTGLIRMGVNASSPELAAKLEAQRKARAEERAAGALEGEFNATRARVRGDVLPIAAADINQRAGIAGMLNSRAANSGGLYASFQPRPGFWGTFGGAFANSLGSSLGRIGYSNPSSGLTMGFARGGNVSDALKRPGDAAAVGEEGPETIVRGGDGDIHVLPNPATSARIPVPPLLTRMLARVVGEDAASASPMLTREPQNGAPAGAVPQTIETRQTAPGVYEPSAHTTGRGDAFTPQRAVSDEAMRKTEELLSRGPFTGSMAAPSFPQPSPAPASASLDMGLTRDPKFSDAQLSPIPQAALDARERLTRPLVRHTGDARADQVDYLNRLEDWRDPADANGRGVSGLKMMGRGFRRGGIVGALTGLVHGLASPNADERAGRDDEIARVDNRLRRLDDHSKDAADVRLRNAQASYAEQRPDLEYAKVQAAEQKAAQQTLLRNLQLFKGQSFDPNNPQHAQFLSDLSAHGITVDPTEWNNDASNLVTVRVVDPEHPERVMGATLNKATGQLDAYGQTAFDQPVGADGVTTYQRGSLALGGARNDETHRHNLVAEGQGSERIGIARENLGLARGRLSLAQAALDNRFSEQDRKRYDSAAKLAAQAERYAAAAESVNLHSKYTDPETGEEKTSSKRMIDSQKLAAQAAALRRQLFMSYPDLFERGEDGRVRMTQQEYRSMFPSLGGGYVGDAQSNGVNLYDADKTGQGTPVPLPLKRPAPRQSSAASPAQAQPKGRVSRANFGKVREQNPQLKNASDAEVEAALRAQGIEVY